jgi:hypothetical protein
MTCHGEKSWCDAGAKHQDIEKNLNKQYEEKVVRKAQYEQ